MPAMAQACKFTQNMDEVGVYVRKTKTFETLHGTRSAFEYVPLKIEQVTPKASNLR